MTTAPSKISEARPRFRRRISLWRLFVLITIITMIASHVQTVRQLLAENQRLAELHKRFGVARVVHPGEPASRLLYVTGDDWRIHVIQPLGKRYRICGSLSNVDQWKRNFPAPEFTMETPDVEQLYVYVSYYKKAPATELSIEMRWANGSILKTVSVPRHHFLDRRTHHENGGKALFHYDNQYSAWQPETAWSQQRAPLLLFVTAEEQQNAWGSDSSLGDGFILWLEEIQPR